MKLSRNKGGRNSLPSDEKRSFSVNVKLNDTEKRIVLSKAKRAGLSPTTYVREAAVFAEVNAKISHSELLLFKELKQEWRNQGINLNILVKKGTFSANDAAAILETNDVLMNLVKKHFRP